jgi:hypothetical protein
VNGNLVSTPTLSKCRVILRKTQALNLRNYASNLKKNNLPVIFTLRHLSKITGVDYRLLRSTVSRRRESANYRMFAIKNVQVEDAIFML